MNPKQWQEKIEALFESDDTDDGQIDAALEQLSQAIAQTVNSAEKADLLKVRAGFWDSMFNRYEAWRDRCAYCQLRADDRDMQLQVAGEQIRRAEYFAEAELDEDSEDYDENLAAAAAKLEHEGINKLFELMHQHAADTDFALQVLSAWQNSFKYSPLHFHELILLARAATPHDRELQKAEALHYFELATSAWNSDTEPERLPPGYFYGLMGHILHGPSLDEALERFDALLQQHAEATLLEKKAELLIELEQFADARACFQAALQQPETETNHDELRQKMAACAADRQHYLNAQLNDLDASLSTVGSQHDKLDAVDQDRLSPDQANTLQRLSEMFADHLSAAKSGFHKAAEGLRAEFETETSQPSEQELDELRQLAERNATSFVTLINDQSVQLEQFEATQFDQPLLPWLIHTQSELAGYGLQPIAYYNNVLTQAQLGRQAQAQLWTDAQAQLALVAETVGNISIRRIQTWFADGTVIMTSDARGRSYWRSPRGVRAIAVDTLTSTEQMLRLHRAALALYLAEFPTAELKPVQTIDDLVQLENHVKSLNNRYRRETGLSSAEIRGMNTKQFTHFAPLMKAAYFEKLSLVD